MFFVCAHFCMVRKPYLIPFERCIKGEKRLRFERVTAFRSSDALLILLRKLPKRWKTRPSKLPCKSSLCPLVSEIGMQIDKNCMYLNQKKFEVIWRTSARDINTMVPFPCQIWQQTYISFFRYSMGYFRVSVMFIQEYLAYIHLKHVSHQPQNHEVLVYLTLALVNKSWVQEVQQGPTSTSQPLWCTIIGTTHVLCAYRLLNAIWMLGSTQNDL